MEDRIIQLEKQVKDLQFILSMFVQPDVYRFERPIQHKGNKIGFYGKTPISQPSTSGTTLNMTVVGGTTVAESNGFSGNTGSTFYTIGDIVKHLKNLGLLAP